MAREPEAGGFRPIQDVAGPAAVRLRVGLFTNNYFPMLGGVPTAVETIRRDLEALGHEVVIVAPRMAGAPEGEQGVIRVPAVPAPTYPDFALPLPLAPSLTRRLRSPRARRVPRSPPVPPGRLGPPSGPGSRPSLRLHVPHALRAVRPLRAAAAPDGRAAGRPLERPVRRHRGPGHRPVRLRRAASPDAGRAAADRGAAHGRRSRPLPARRSAQPPAGPSGSAPTTACSSTSAAWTARRTSSSS